MAVGLRESSISNTQQLDKMSLIHDVYRSLFEKGRTYAAFEVERTLPLIESIRTRGTIIDPMSGYGTLMSICSTLPYEINTVNIECNIPSFYWQILMNPQNTSPLLQLCDAIEKKIDKIADTPKRAVVCNSWYPDDSYLLLKSLWKVTMKEAMALKPIVDYEDITIAFILPFVARLSSYVHGNVVTHVKEGGICVYTGWKTDLAAYVDLLRASLLSKITSHNSSKHYNILGDARTVSLDGHFSAMITSPPYPNGTDYSRMFAPENAWIKWIISEGLVKKRLLSNRLIGSPIVSENEMNRKRTISDITSPSACRFIKLFASYRGTKKAEYDNKIYYIPYFCNYFYDLQHAYSNVSKLLADDFEGYIIVINNTARKIVVPVAESIIDIWKALGFKAKIDTRYTREVSHVGGINPDVKGLSARHTEYVIKVWKHD